MFLQCVYADEHERNGGKEQNGDERKTVSFHTPSMRKNVRNIRWILAKR